MRFRSEDIRLRQGEKKWTPPLVLILLLIVISIIYVLPYVKTTFAGSHTMYNNTSGDYGSATFCYKCHPDIVRTINNSNIAHNKTECICHGYYRNYTNATRNTNLVHNLTLNIYCTNCHSTYNATGELFISNGTDEINVINQSAHYITNNTHLLYNHSKEYFKEYFM
jgi:hypothetical protein